MEIKHTAFNTMESLNVWQKDCKGKIEIVNIHFESKSMFDMDMHHVYYRVKNNFWFYLLLYVSKAKNRFNGI